MLPLLTAETAIGPIRHGSDVSIIKVRCGLTLHEKTNAPCDIMIHTPCNQFSVVQTHRDDSRIECHFHLVPDVRLIRGVKCRERFRFAVRVSDELHLDTV